MTDPKNELLLHLLHEHEVLLTTSEYFAASLDDLRVLDPCETA